MDPLINQPEHIKIKLSVPEPFLFNSLKHHAGFVSCLIRNYEPNDMTRENELKKVLNITGKSQTDLYTGNLSPLQISDQIKQYLESRDLLKRENYMGWINSAANLYRKIILSDGSAWILLPGKTEGRYVHIHPGRYSPFTVRVRSDTLKTAIAVLIHCRQGKCLPEISVVNKLRTVVLGLSPVREIKWEKGIGRIISILESHPISLVIAIAAIVPSATAVVI